MKLEPRRVVLDANILLRAVLGVRALELLETYQEQVDFFTPSICFEDARRHLPDLLRRRGLDAGAGLLALERLAALIESIEEEWYIEFEAAARSRMASRDEMDWPIVATAMLLDCPIWTQDRDFFGCGVAIWTTETVEMYLRDEALDAGTVDSET